MIQILGLREFTTDQGELRRYDAFFNNNWRAKSIKDLFENLEKYLSLIPEDQRWNIFYTVANCTEEKRKFLSQDVVPIDIDGITPGTEGEVTAAVLAELKLSKDQVAIVYSGNGVHILIGLARAITDVSFIRTNKVYYKALCGRVNQALFNAGLDGDADTTVFSESRILRLPYTKNIKPGKQTKECVVVSTNITPLDVDLFTLSDIPSVGDGEHVHPNAYMRMPEPDTEAVQTKCGFIKHCYETQESISEPEWYAMLSIVGRLKDGTKLVHEYSKKYPHYSPGSTDYKVTHALEASGPRTCANISTMYAGCEKCPYFKKITSPIQIIGEDTIRTQKTGFYDVVVKNGMPTRGKPNYDDLEKWFAKNFTYLATHEDEQLYIFINTHWEEMPRLSVHTFAEKNFKPSPTNGMCTEFEGKLKRMNNIGRDFFRVEGKLNFKNGVFDLATGKMEEHSKKYGFLYTIPYEFTPKGDCPQFKKFIDEVTCGDAGIKSLLLEFMGACMADANPMYLQKCVVLFGDGSNGKSVLLNLMRELVGQKNCSAISMDNIKKETHRYSMVGKMFNVSSETPTSAFLDSDEFKAMVAGDIVTVRRLYGDPVEWNCTTKLMFACNELPYGNDYSYGFTRRLIIIPFNATFSKEKGNMDPYILDKLLEERSDIFMFLLEHYKNLAARDFRFQEPSVVKDQLTDYTSMSDSVGRFTEEMCMRDPNKSSSIKLDLLYRTYVSWSQDTAQKPVNYGAFVRRFGRSVNRYLPECEKRRATNEHGVKVTSYTGLLVKIPGVEINA